MRHKLKRVSLLVLWLSCGVTVYAQTNTAGQNTITRRPVSTGASASGIENSTLSIDVNQNVMLARSSADYRVTPGDVYTLAYAAGTTPVSYTITVDASYRIRVSNLGVINGEGKTLMQLRREVEATVANNYPLSGVQLVLVQPAVFRVYVTGEVYTAREVTAWGLSRLSSLVPGLPADIPDTGTGGPVAAGSTGAEILRNNLPQGSAAVTAYASMRDITVKSLNGQVKVYDLFQAQRQGDTGQDPYLRPGDVITFQRVKRQVSLSGEVERPGLYQLRDGENLSELLREYGKGLTVLADESRLELVRLVNSEHPSGDKLFLTKKDVEENYTLEHYDRVTVPSLTQLQSVMFVEGAVREIAGVRAADDSSTTAGAELSAAGRLVVQFAAGETYASLVREHVQWFTAVSDTRNAYIQRGGERILLNLNPMLYDADYRDEVLVQENDVLIIPFRQYFVTVAGAVLNPGRYPYIPDRDWEYYIGLAGGFIAEKNARQVVKMTDMRGKELKKSELISPETVITASTNHMLYYVNQWAPVVTTLLSIASTTLSIYLMTRQ